jgi:outer membrane protein TolC
MTRALGIVAGVLVAVAIAGAEEDPELRAAQRELKLARAHLQEADRDYEGHRRKAVEYVDQALSELRIALEVDKANRAGDSRPKKDTDVDASEDD